MSDSLRNSASEARYIQDLVQPDLDRMRQAFQSHVEKVMARDVFRYIFKAPGNSHDRRKAFRKLSNRFKWKQPFLP